MLIFLFFLHQKSITTFFYLVRNFDTFFNKYYIANGVIPPFLNFAFSLLNVLASLLIIILLFGLAIRNDTFRKIIIILILISVIIGFYYMYIAYFTQNTYAHKIISLIVYGLFSLIYLGIFFLYKSNFMKAFFQAPKRKPNSIMPKEE